MIAVTTASSIHTKQQVPVGGRSRASPIHGSLALALQRVPRPASGIVRRQPLTVSFLAANQSPLIITGLSLRDRPFMQTLYANFVTQRKQPPIRKRKINCQAYNQF
jgi:hypothetical protein